jgi:hypothetical protein
MRSKTLRPALLSTVLGLGLGLTVGACNPYDPDYGEIPFKCGPNDACPDGYTCNDSDLCALEGAEENCADDGPFEPNDSIDNATSTPVASERDTINYASLSICGSSDVDVYAVTVPANGLNLTATMMYESGSPLEMRLLNDAGTLILNGTDDDGVVTAAATNLPLGTFFVEVTSSDGGSNDYRLDLESF